jgi:hypothetical protein
MWMSARAQPEGFSIFFLGSNPSRMHTVAPEYIAAIASCVAEEIDHRIYRLQTDTSSRGASLGRKNFIEILRN